ncbi:MAG: hypothetical protein E6I78_06995 [Chloroflexi bacterium]|nr:MAG: hypothetical protein E6I78_06995 [Chloroflexota bacterium]
MPLANVRPGAAPAHRRTGWRSRERSGSRARYQWPDRCSAARGCSASGGRLRRGRGRCPVPRRPRPAESRRAGPSKRPPHHRLRRAERQHRRAVIPSPGRQPRCPPPRRS